MRAVIQRVSHASVEVSGTIVGEIDQGLVILVGITHSDSEENVRNIGSKIIGLRLFNDSDGKMNLSVKDIEGSILVVSNFTLYADMNKGFRPNFLEAAKPDIAENLYKLLVQFLTKQSFVNVQTGIFGAMMKVSLTNDGPVTIILDR